MAETGVEVLRIPMPSPLLGLLRARMPSPARFCGEELQARNASHAWAGRKKTQNRGSQDSDESLKLGSCFRRGIATFVS